MTLGCRICQRTDVEKLLSIFREIADHEKTIADMIDAVRGSKMEDDDRLPQQVCNGCFMQLDLAYSLRLDIRHSLRMLLLNPATISRCLLCSASNDKKELISVGCIYERRNIKISDMIEKLIGEQIRDSSSKYVCSACRIKVDFAYDLREKCLESELTWLNEVSYPWEKMEVDGSAPEHLIFDLYAERLQDEGRPAHCSVCLLTVDSKRSGTKCKGCKLEFRKRATMGVKALVSASKMDCSEDEEYLETVDEEELIIDSLDLSASSYLGVEGAEEVPNGTSWDMKMDTEEENSQAPYASANEDDDDEFDDANYSMAAKPDKDFKNTGYVEEPEKLFDIFEAYAGDPFPTVLRKGPCCCKCFKFFATQSDLANHQTQSHGSPTGTGKFSCDVCRTLFPKQQALEEHRKCLDTFLYDFCKSCQIVFGTSKMFRKHKSKNHLDLEMIKEAESRFIHEVVVDYACCVVGCHNRYSSEERLRKHLEVVHNQEDWAVLVSEDTCSYCKREFSSQSSLLTHWRTEKEQYRCLVDGCNFVRTDKQIMWVHCSQVPPHIKTKTDTKTLVPDMKHFTVIGTLDNDTDILQRNCMFCCRCFVVFETEEELAAHCDLHTVGVGKPFQCQVCRRGFTRVGLTQHNRLQEIPTHFYCRPCNVFLWSKLNYAFHKIANHLYDDDLSDNIQTEKDRFHACCGCWNTFRTEKELIVHRGQFHPPPVDSDGSKEKKYPKCDYCHQCMFSTKQLEKHIASYESKVTYSCKVSECTFKTKDMDQMRQHIFHGIHKSTAGTFMKMKGAGPDDYRCCHRKCVFRCTDYDELIEHGRAMHAFEREQIAICQKNPQFTCPVCCKGFDKQITLYHHKRSKRKLACPTCQKLFLREELPEHSSQCTERLKCEICSKEMSSRSALNRHRNAVHSANKKDDTKTVCNICGKLVKYMKIHMQSHDNKREWVCPVCGASFNDVARLRLHTFVHSDVRNYPCRKGCDKLYKYQGDRDRHEKSVHLGIKPFACSNCNESFIRKRELRVHQTKHTGQKLYSCSQCNDSFDVYREFVEHCAQHGSTTDQQFL